MKQNFHYIPSSYLSLILRITANNTFVNNDDWSIAFIGQLISNSQIINILDFDDISYIHFDFIQNDYQWLYTYHAFIHGYKAILKLPDVIDGTSWQVFDSAGYPKKFETNDLKKCAKLFIDDIIKITHFPNLEQDWLNIFKYLHENNILWYNIEHLTAKEIHYHPAHHQLYDEHHQIIHWYDILSMKVNSNIELFIQQFPFCYLSILNDDYTLFTSYHSDKVWEKTYHLSPE